MHRHVRILDFYEPWLRTDRRQERTASKEARRPTNSSSPNLPGEVGRSLNGLRGFRELRNSSCPPCHSLRRLRPTQLLLLCGTTQRLWTLGMQAATSSKSISNDCDRHGLGASNYDQNSPRHPFHASAATPCRVPSSIPHKRSSF
jgi:hypothetical protein